MEEDQPLATEHGQAEHPISAGETLPTNFFTDASRSRILTSEDDVDEQKPPIDIGSPSTQAATTTVTSVDLEYEMFQRDVVNAADHRDVYDGATVFAEAQLALETPEGFPQISNDTGLESGEAEKDDISARAKQEHDERELIMDRLLDEERAQEEADDKVCKIAEAQNRIHFSL
jgi:zinc finger protein 830